MSLTEVRWLQRTDADVPADNSWLSAAEADRAERFRIPKRRSDWRLGRWTAKQAVALHLGLPPDSVSLALTEIRPAASGAPEVFISNRPAELAISLSHRAGVAMCAVAAPDVQLGCDLELVEPHSPAFVRDYFTAEERALIAANPEASEFLVSLIWSAKESALKALRTGLRDDTRSVSIYAVEPFSVEDGWAQLSIRVYEGRVLRGWWQQCDKLLRTLIAAPAAHVPVALR